MHIQVLSSEGLQQLSIGVDGGHSIDGKQFKPTLCWVPGAVHFHAVGQSVLAALQLIDTVDEILKMSWFGDVFAHLEVV